MIAGIIQARFSSSRLPGKVLKEVLDRPMLALQIERLQRSKKVDKWILATSSDASDDKIAELSKKLGLACYRGSLNDVLDRYYNAALILNPSHIVRVTGDCPLHDAALIDEMISHYLELGVDYLCNTIRPTFPDGLDAWVFKFSALKKSWEEAKRPSEREHVTMFIKNNLSLFKTYSFEDKCDFSYLRWTVDEEKDLEFVKLVYEKLYRANPTFSWKDVLKLLKQEPELATINSGFIRDEGLLKSLEVDKKLGF